MNKKMVIWFMLSFFAGMVSASTTVSKVIVTNEIWTANGSPYLISENTAVLKGASVTVMPGVEVRGVGTNVILAIHGGFTCLGKPDSMIAIQEMMLQFNSTCPDYDPISGKGTRMIYTSFKLGSGGTTAVTLSKVNLLFDHCLFDGGYYGIYGNSDSCKIWVTNSKFKNPNKFIFPVDGFYFGSYLEFIGNSVENMGSLKLAEKSVIRNNYFLGSYGTTQGLDIQYSTREAIVECNYFNNLYYGINASHFYSGLKKMIVSNNNFDSCQFVIYLNSEYNLKDSLKIHNNNFSNYINSLYVYLGSNLTPNSWYDMSSNYWGSMDTNTIFSTFADNRNTGFIRTKVNISDYLSSPVSTCWPTQPSKLSKVDKFNRELFSIKLSPNPASDFIQISTLKSANYDVEIFQLNGVRVMETLFTGTELQLGISKLKKGLYLVKITDTVGNAGTEKLLVQ